MKFNQAMFGVIIAKLALAYDALSMAVSPGMIVGVLVVSVHAEGILSTTRNTHVHVADSSSLFIIMVNV